MWVAEADRGCFIIVVVDIDVSPGTGSDPE